MTAAAFDSVGWALRPAPLPGSWSAFLSTAADRVFDLRGPAAEHHVVSTRVPERSDFVPQGPSEVQASPLSDARVQERLALIRALLEYCRLQEDWDGYGGLPAHPRALLNALTFLQNWRADLPLPSPMLAGSGAVGLYWDRGTHYASLEFEGDNTYTYLTDGPEGYGGGENVPARTLARPLERFLQSMPCAE